VIATYRYDVGDAGAERHRERMGALLPRIALEPGIAGAHLLVADPVGSAIETAEKRARANATQVPRWIVLLEGWGDVEPFVHAARSFAAHDAFADGLAPVQWAVYRLQNSRSAPRRHP
jgi:hypothetical protein